MQQEEDPCQIYLRDSIQCSYNDDINYEILQPQAKSKERIFNNAIVDCIPWTFGRTIKASMQPIEPYVHTPSEFPHYFPITTNESTVSLEQASNNSFHHGSLFMSDIPLPPINLVTSGYNALVRNPKNIIPPVVGNENYSGTHTLWKRMCIIQLNEFRRLHRLYRSYRPKHDKRSKFAQKRQRYKGRFLPLEPIKEEEEEETFNRSKKKKAPRSPKERVNQNLLCV